MDHDARIDLRLPEEEKKDIQSRAATEGLSVSLYIRSVLYHYDILKTWAETRIKVNPGA
jgi:predicted DNA binding CopG/RHH family protein